ncbi:MAG: phosphatase PAP2 family protein [Deltaproteobacteria bacterium]|nr:phosphatase PAP2 family protein [Deltaproteobacteria bacterium]
MAAAVAQRGQGERPARAIPLASWIDDWGRWLLRSYFTGSLACLCSFTAINFFTDVPGSRLMNALTASLFAPLAWILTSVVLRLRRWRRGELCVTPVDAVTGPGWLGQISQMRWLIATVLMFGLWPGAYFVANQLAGFREPVQFHFAVDQRIPMRTELSMVYVGIYWFFIFPLLYGRGRELFWPLLRAYGTIMAICAACFILYPVEYPRAPLVVRHMGDWTLALVHGADPPTNCFPSSHCAVAIFAALGLRRIRPSAALPGFGVALGICVATVLTRQHYLIDTVAGMALGIGVYLYFLRPRLETSLAPAGAARAPTERPPA